jgi:hypothetical protein
MIFVFWIRIGSPPPAARLENKGNAKTAASPLSSVPGVKTNPSRILPSGRVPLYVSIKVSNFDKEK